MWPFPKRNAGLFVGGSGCEVTCSMSSSGDPWVCIAERHYCDGIPEGMHVEHGGALGWKVTDHEQEGQNVWELRNCPYCGEMLEKVLSEK